MRAEADIAWYTKISKERGSLPRCPFASPTRCPRYYFSASLGKHIGAAALSDEDEQRLEHQWRSSPYWIHPHETATSVSGGDGKKSLSRFCPEYVFSVFGVFAESVVPYQTDDEKEQMLSIAMTPNWRFQWHKIEELHYSDCPYYSMLSAKVEPQTPAESEREADLVIAQPGIFGFSLDLKTLMNRFCRWWLKKNG